METELYITAHCDLAGSWLLAVLLRTESSCPTLTFRLYPLGLFFCLSLEESSTLAALQPVHDQGLGGHGVSLPCRVTPPWR